MSSVFKKLPGVLSLNRCVSVTDALFFNLHAGGRESPLNVTRSGLRGTQNINKAAATSRDEVSNIQVTDTAKTASDAIGLVVRMAVGYHALTGGLNACALSKQDDESLLEEFRNSYIGFIERAGASEGLAEVARRFARNIANGRWLWRNRKFAVSVTTKVTAGDTVFVFNSLSIPSNTFDNYGADEVALGAIIAQSLAGKSFTPLQVEATIDFGKGLNAGIEVFPSQNYLGDKKPDGFARSLYAVGVRPKQVDGLMNIESSRIIGQAAIRDTKAANALRTIDTWFADFDSYGQPIAVEPAGANLEAQRIFRAGKTSSFSYAKQLNIIEPDSPEGMFMIAALVRGGVYSEGAEK